MPDIARITEIVKPEADALGFEIVRVAMIGSGEERSLQIMAERPETGQLVIEDCAALSRRVSDRIDDLEEAGEVLIEGAYRLEVSSPGIDRPLTRPKDFADWAGHETKVALIEGVDVEGGKPRKALAGPLIGIEGDHVTLDDKKSGRVSFRLSDVHSARLVLTDRLIAATAPIDASGADEVEDEGEYEDRDRDEILAGQEE